MKLHLVLSLLAAAFLFCCVPSNYAASSAHGAPLHRVSALKSEQKAAAAGHFKKEKRQNRLKSWWENKIGKFFQKSRRSQRWSLGFVGFIVTMLGAMFIVLGIVIPYLGILFLVIGIIIAFVGIILWALLGKIGVRVSTGDERDRRAN